MRDCEWFKKKMPNEKWKSARTSYIRQDDDDVRFVQEQ
jgi:hypothetical protein